MSWVNILDIIYPIGSVYMSTESSSPASCIGGTWTQLTGGVLACAGSDGFASAAQNGGSKTITIDQMPKHRHYHNEGTWIAYIGNSSSSRNGGSVTGGINLSWGGGYTDAWVTSVYAGGGKIISLPTVPFTFGTAQLKNKRGVIVWL